MINSIKKLALVAGAVATMAMVPIQSYAATNSPNYKINLGQNEWKYAFDDQVRNSV